MCPCTDWQNHEHSCTLSGLICVSVLWWSRFFGCCVQLNCLGAESKTLSAWLWWCKLENIICVTHIHTPSWHHKHAHSDTDGMIWHVLALWLKCVALTCPSPIRACADCSSLLETKHGGFGGGARGGRCGGWVAPWQGGRKLQPRGGSSSALLSAPLWPDGVNQSSPKMSASAQAISDWNKWQMGMLFPLFNQFHQMWFYLL